MSDVHEIIVKSSSAVHEGRFSEASRMLTDYLEVCTEESEMDLLLQQLMHLYSHTENLDTQRAQAYMDLREAKQPLAHIALSQAYFKLYTLVDRSAAQEWARKAIQRAYAEEDWSTLYSASAIAGMLASHSYKHDPPAIKKALQTLSSLVGKDHFICYGDATLFLEQTASDPETAIEARTLAARIAPLIEDDDFRARTAALV